MKKGERLLTEMSFLFSGYGKLKPRKSLLRSMLLCSREGEKLGVKNKAPEFLPEFLASPSLFFGALGDRALPFALRPQCHFDFCER